MSDELELLPLDPLVKERLPLGFQRIFVSESILDAETTERLMLEHSKYRHRNTFVRHPHKPISKLEI